MTPPPSCVGPSCTDGACSARTCEVAPPPPPEPAPRPLPGCASRRCPEDFGQSGIAGRFPNGTAACEAATTCVRDVFPGCTNYRGASDSPWGTWCVVRGGRRGAHRSREGGLKRPTTGAQTRYRISMRTSPCPGILATSSTPSFTLSPRRARRRRRRYMLQ